MIDFLSRLDKRWIYLAMLLAVSLPILFQLSFPEKSTPIVQAAFDEIESLPPGSKVLVSLDYDPSSSGELDPMTTALVRHLCLKKHKIYFMALWPLGPDLAKKVTREVIEADFPEMKYGVDYINLGYKSGQEGVILVIVDDLKKLYPSDTTGISLSTFDITRDVKNIREMKLLINVGAGWPGTKEWIQYASTPYKIPTVCGCPGVQAPQLYPYYPNQMLGMLPAIKGAAEYEVALGDKYPQYASAAQKQGLRRMSPQLVAHALMITLIILGNVVYFAQRREEFGREKETLIWLLLFVAGGSFLAYRAATHGMALAYVRQLDGRTVSEPPRESLTAGTTISIPRTFGNWMAAFFTLCIMSFLYRDNPFYKFAEAIVVGVSAAYWMVVALWTVVVPNIFGKIIPDFVSRTVMPGTIANVDWVYWIPLILGVMLLCRLLPKGGWLSRWPLALIIGTTAGMRMIAYLEADFVSQIYNTILPVLVWKLDENNLRVFDFWQSIKNATIIVGVFAGLVYFFFSVEHKGMVGRVSRLGIWFLMITFGAAFAYTVMGRITLLAGRMEFLFDDWLWLIDPSGSRLGM